MTENKIETLRWAEDHLEMIDQRILPADFQYISYNSALQWLMEFVQWSCVVHQL